MAPLKTDDISEDDCSIIDVDIAQATKTECLISLYNMCNNHEAKYIHQVIFGNQKSLKQAVYAFSNPIRNEGKGSSAYLIYLCLSFFALILEIEDK